MEELYPEDFTEEDKLNYDMYLEQAKVLFPKLKNDIWLVKMGIIAYIRKEKKGVDTKLSDEEVAALKNCYTNNTIFHTPTEEPKGPSEDVSIELNTE